MLNDPFNPVVGAVDQIATGISRILAPNPSPMTYRGTNTYLLGTKSFAVIDPGPHDAQHQAAILAAIGQKPLTHIFVTHSHIDHSPLAKPLAAETGAQVLGFGPSDAGQSAVMRQLAQDGLAGGGEGIDLHFEPDIHLNDGAVVAGDDWQIRAIHTPGHMGNHLCYVWDQHLFSGDLVMGWASSMVSPPDGDLTDFMASCQRLKRETALTFCPGHGDLIHTPQDRLKWLIDHRTQRTNDILAALETGPKDVATLTREIYTDVAPALHPAAARNVFAHLIDLQTRQIVSAVPTLSPAAKFALMSTP